MDDLRWIQVMVATVYVLDTLHQFMLCHFIYSYTVFWFGDYVFLRLNAPEIGAYCKTQGMVLFSFLVWIIIQSFLTYRIWILNKRNVLITGGTLTTSTPADVILHTSTCWFSGSSLSAPLTFLKRMNSILQDKVPKTILSHTSFHRWSKGTYARLALELNVLSRLVNAFGAAGDIAITVALIWLLKKSKSGVPRTDVIVTKVITFCLTTGLATSVDAILPLISLRNVWFHLRSNNKYVRRLVRWGPKPDIAGHRRANKGVSFRVAVKNAMSSGVSIF
ncbi:hypothetical protein K435DRAFT_794872 [Dendrothele bispora CBS 962.96]|uniref:DUF6534 domain-containing protein n=1 Tax=Dendrothele bispora (strain CBS 962.96) TaxID=1314807 RepID=A0A4S8MB96_DENBC|nr:hypothetical protein K435DRAFT_794872 [Dendrothele bispora CBS 962.96]